LNGGIKISKDFLGTGWKFPFNVDSRGKMGVSSYEDGIKESILIILGTAKGERLMRPDFGCDIFKYTFCSMNTLNINLIESTVLEALIKWEPRIEVISVKAKPESGEGKLMITIDYQVRANNTRFNLVYPFYLKEGV
jgi:uncharacterized protein